MCDFFAGTQDFNQTPTVSNVETHSVGNTVFAGIVGDTITAKVVHGSDLTLRPEISAVTETPSSTTGAQISSILIPTMPPARDGVEIERLSRHCATRSSTQLGLNDGAPSGGVICL